MVEVSSALLERFFVCLIRKIPKRGALRIRMATTSRARSRLPMSPRHGLIGGRWESGEQSISSCLYRMGAWSPSFIPHRTRSPVIGEANEWILNIMFVGRRERSDAKRFFDAQTRENTDSLPEVQ